MFTPNNDILVLDKQQPVNAGARRIVYVHPNNSHYLIKISKFTLNLYQNQHSLSFTEKRRYLKYVGRELVEYVRSRVAFAGLPQPCFIQQIVGFVDTDLGLGVVVKAERDEHDNLAPQLAHLIAHNLWCDTKKKHLQAFLEQLAVTDLSVDDLTISNVVYAYDKEHGHYFTLVDGIGDKYLIRLCVYSKWYRTYLRKKKIKQFRQKIDDMLKHSSRA